MRVHIAQSGAGGGAGGEGSEAPLSLAGQETAMTMLTPSQLHSVDLSEGGGGASQVPTQLVDTRDPPPGMLARRTTSVAQPKYANRHPHGLEHALDDVHTLPHGKE